MTLFHVSEDPNIQCFVPRMSDNYRAPVVWAVDAARLRNYLVPRDCPRVTCYAGPATTAEDVDRFLGSSSAVVAIEDAWLARLRSAVLYCYELPANGFTCIDEGAGYFVSEATVAPTRTEIIDDPIHELLERNVELRFAPSLWPLRDAVIASTLQFSVIRMRNAQPPGPENTLPCQDLGRTWSLRQAQPRDIAGMHRVRLSVRENRLVSIVLSEQDYVEAIGRTGRGWVVEIQGMIVAFAIGDARTGSIWALFVEPGHEGRGYARILHDATIAWLWQQGHDRLWLTTAPDTRAQRFYERAGWQCVGSAQSGELRFELARPR